jgi:hypothetical protein
MGIRRREERANQQHLCMSVITAVAMLIVIGVVGFCDWSVFMSEEDRIFKQAVQLLDAGDPKGALRVCAAWSARPNWVPDERYAAVVSRACRAIQKPITARYNQDAAIEIILGRQP